LKIDGGLIPLSFLTDWSDIGREDGRAHWSSNGVFKGWKGKEDKRRKIFSSLLKAIKEAQPLPIGCIFSSEDFRNLPERDQKLMAKLSRRMTSNSRTRIMP